MPEGSRTKILMSTLAELRNEERSSEKAQLRLQLKEHVKCFVEEFQTEHGYRRPLTKISRRKAD